MSLFKRAAASANIRITSHRQGGRSIEDEFMEGSSFPEEDTSRQRGRGYRGGGRPRMISSQGGHYNYRGGRWPRSRGRGGGGFRSEHDDRDKSVTERLGERLGYKNRGRGRRGGYNSSYRYDKGYTGTHSGTAADAKRHQWYQVTIPYGKKAEKDFIYKSINELLDIPFQPMAFRHEGQAAIFYVEMSVTSIEALRAIDKRIKLPNGFQMKLIIKLSDPPVPKSIEGDLLESLLQCMNSVYDVENKVLDLSKFHKNELLNDVVLPLNRSSVLTAVVNTVKEHIPDLVGLNLSENRLSSLVYLQPLVAATPSLVGLDLSNNPELKEGELERLRGWNLTEVNLSGTEFAKRFTDKALYLSAVRKKFPRITMLDGESAPVPIGFAGLEDDTGKELPAFSGNFLAPASELVTRFIQQYYELFDGDDRSPLAAAYHDQATLSTSFFYNHRIDRQQPRFDLQSSRNLLKLVHAGERVKRLIKGKDNVINYYTAEFPKTKHLLDTLNVDVLHQSPEMLSFCITGLYDEPNPSSSSAICRTFLRNFTTVPQGEGIVIISEQVSLSNVSRDTRSQLMKAARGTLPSAQAAVTASTSAHSMVGSAPNQQSMIQTVMSATRMNAHWSEQCLSANNWDVTKAQEMFKSLMAEGKIPNEAFQP